MTISSGFVLSQNNASVGTLYREPLGEILVHYDNVYKIEKGQYN